jgi:dipeptidyl aminopeptidase/acylaminoacyl peptidase
VTSALPDVDSVTVASDNRGLYFIGGDKVQRVSLNGGDIVDAAKFDGQAFYYKLDGSIDSGGHAVGVSISPTGMAAEFFQGTTKLKSVKLPPTIGRPVAGDAKSGALVFQSAGAGGSVLSAVDQSGRVQTIIAINEHLKQVIPAKEVQLKYKLPNGDQTSACLLLPANAPPGKKLPTIVWVYPGGAGARCQSLWQLGLADTYSAEILTSFGYAVLTPPAPAPLLTDGHNPVANWGALVQPAVDEAVAEGYTDKDKLGAWGMSLGGHSVLSLLSQTNMFKAAIALNGAADFFSNYASLGTVRSVLSDDLFAVGHSTLYEGAPEEGAHLGAPPWEIPQAYAIASPLSNAGKMNTPLMLFANDLDWDYQMTEFDQYFIAMVRQGKEAVYVRSWGEGHGDTNPANVRESWRRMHAWYEQHFNAVP